MCKTADTVWALVTAGQQDEQLFKVLAKIAEQRLELFNSQEFANTAWAFAKVGQLAVSRKMVISVSARTQPCPCSMH